MKPFACGHLMRLSDQSAEAIKGMCNASPGDPVSAFSAILLVRNCLTWNV